MVSFVSAQRKRFCGATAAAFLVMFVLYALMGSNNDSNGNTDNNTMRVDGSKRSASIDAVASNNDVCPIMPAVYDIGTKKPIWVAGYPGSGFDLLAPLIAYSTGLTAVDVYRHHTCSVPARPGAAVTGACLTHFPVIAKDSPSSVALTGSFYNPNVIFVIRNPVKAIPSYFTRWWGAQKHVQKNHQQPPKEEWIEWRDDRFEHHLSMWKQSIIEWQRGIPAAGIAGIKLYVPFEELSSPTKGPLLTREVANMYKDNQFTIHKDAACLWRRAVDRSQLHKARAYEPVFTAAQMTTMRNTLDELIGLYGTADPKLLEILQSYRDDLN